MENDQEEDVQSKDKQASDVFRLWVKLKLPKEEDRNIGDQKYGFRNKDPNMKRVCDICHKVFSSGKALGGHMRIHVQRTNKKDVVLKEKLKVHQTITFKKEEKVMDFLRNKHHNNKASTNWHGSCSGNMIMKPSCIICGKDFPSMKSLFGHMRCHPDRCWRGIHPPPSMPKNTPSSTSSLSDANPPKTHDRMELSSSSTLDLTQSLTTGWLATARRGRKAMVVASSSGDDHLQEAVNYLMMLARGGATQSQNFGESETSALSFCKAEVIETNPAITIHSQVGNEQRCSINEAVKVIVHGESVTKLDGLEEHEHNYSSDDTQMDKLIDTDFESSNKKVVIKNKMKRKKVKLCDLGWPVHDQKVVVDELTSKPVTPYKYMCNTCHKSYTTHQALGGHRSSNNRCNITIHSPNPMGEKSDNISHHPTSQVEETCTSSNLQQQSINMTTAQAPGSHKRCYGDGLVEAPPSQVAESKASHLFRRVLEFDLNEVPPSQDKADFALGNYDRSCLSIY